jgi:hypothetical protein
MNIKWGQLFDVFAVSLGSTLAVVVLVSLGLLGLSARAARPVALVAAQAGNAARRAPFSNSAGTAVAVVCLAGAAAIVLSGIWVLVAR